jgi:flotillin
MFGFDTACLGTGIVIALVFGVLVLLLTVFALAKRYVTVPPNMAMIVYGRKYGKNFKIISGGGKFIVPIIERYKFLDLGIHKLTFEISAITVDKVTITINCVLNAKVGSTEELIRKAAERFLDKQNQIEEIIRDTSEGSARAIIGTLTIESIIEKREEFASMVIEYAGKDLAALGLEIDVFTIKDISDEPPEGGGMSYLNALEAKRISQVVSDSRMEQARADSAARQIEAVQRFEAEKTEREADTGIAEAEKELAVKKATYKSEADSEARKADQAGSLSSAQAEQAVASEEEKLARIREQQIQAQLQYEIVKPAEAQKDAEIMRAEGVKQSAIRQAEGEAARIQKTKEADAAGEAAKIKMAMTAEATGIRAKLLAEAEGKSLLAEALAKLDENGVLLLVLEKVPDILVGVPDIARAINEPLGNIDNITIVGGGNDGSGSGTLGNLVGELPRSTLKLLVESGALLKALMQTKEGRDLVAGLSGAIPGLENLAKLVETAAGAETVEVSSVPAKQTPIEQPPPKKKAPAKKREGGKKN